MRLTYKSFMGDYGCAIEFESRSEETAAFRNRLGAFEDLGYEPEDLKKIVEEYNREHSN